MRLKICATPSHLPNSFYGGIAKRTATSTYVIPVWKVFSETHVSPFVKIHVKYLVLSAKLHNETFEAIFSEYVKEHLEAVMLVKSLRF